MKKLFLIGILLCGSMAYSNTSIETADVSMDKVVLDGLSFDSVDFDVVFDNDFEFNTDFTFSGTVSFSYNGVESKTNDSALVNGTTSDIVLRNKGPDKT